MNESTEPQPPPTNSFRQILRSSSIIASASIVSVCSGIARQKVAAVILGPAGVGLVGLFQNIVAVGSGFSSLGVGVSATRELASATVRDDQRSIASIRKALMQLTTVQVAVGVVVFWGLHGWLARNIVQDQSQAPTIAWLSLAIGFGIITAAQSGLVLGLRRIGDSARITVTGALMSALASAAVLYWLGQDGIAAFVILPPACTAVVGWFYVGRLPRPLSIKTKARELFGHWRSMAALGIALTAGGSAILLGQLALRILIQRELGIIALGLFQAASTLSLTYIGFVLNAMGADYSPRLTMVINDPKAANRLVNEQTEVALLLAAPFLLLALGAAPWLFHLFYSSAFADAAGIFRWQVLGDILKIASWPLGFILVARGEGRTYVMTEVGATLILLLLAWVGIPYFGLAGTGLAYFGMYTLYLPTVYLLAVHRMGFQWSGCVVRTFVVLAAGCGFVAALALVSQRAAATCGALLAIAAAFIAYRRLGSFLPEPVTRLLRHR